MAAVSSQSRWLFQWYVRLKNYCHTNTFAWLPSPIHQSIRPLRNIPLVNLLKILSPPLFVADLRLRPVVQLNVSISTDVDICMNNLCSGKRNSNHPDWLIHSFIHSFIFFIMLTLIELFWLLMSYYEVSLGGSNLNLDDQAWIIVVECADCCYLSTKITDRLTWRKSPQ